MHVERTARVCRDLEVRFAAPKKKRTPRRGILDVDLGVRVQREQRFVRKLLAELAADRGLEARGEETGIGAEERVPGHREEPRCHDAEKKGGERGPAEACG